MCRLSSVCLSSIVCDVLYCGETVRLGLLAKTCLKERIGNQGQKVDFLARRYISTSGFAVWRPKRPFLPYFARTAQQSVLDGTNGLASSKPCAYYRIVRSELKPEVVLATIIDPEWCK